MPVADKRARQLRDEIRAGRVTGLTTGMAAGHVQCNLVVLPAAHAADFETFCRANASACPLLGMSQPGDAALPALGDGIDVRTDLPGYRVSIAGQLPFEVSDIRSYWRDDAVALAIGCWFSMEQALLAAGVRLRHVEQGIQGPLFKTTLPATSAGHFSGPLVVSMRPFAPDEVERVRAVTARFPRVHGAPLHTGTPDALGIRDLMQPDYGEPIEMETDAVPVYWGCGLTALAALERAALPWYITHAPGKMLVTDLLNASLEER